MGWLGQCGFSHFDHFTPETCDQRFYQGRKDDLLAPVVEQFVSAVRSGEAPIA